MEACVLGTCSHSRTWQSGHNSSSYLASVQAYLYDSSFPSKALLCGPPALSWVPLCCSPKRIAFYSRAHSVNSRAWAVHGTCTISAHYKQHCYPLLVSSACKESILLSLKSLLHSARRAGAESASLALLSGSREQCLCGKHR